VSFSVPLFINLWK